MTTFFVFKGKGGNNVNKNRSNLVLSLVSLVITSFLLVFTVYSWYTSNQEVKASSIVGATDIEHTTFTLEKYSASATDWVNVSKIEEKNVLPGTTTYFRLKCVNDNNFTVSLTAKFEGIESKLDTTYVKVSSDGKNVTYNGIKAYDIVNNQVKVTPVIDGGDSKNILYEISSGNIMLKHFKIQEGYIIQRFGQTETKTGAVLSRDDVNDQLDTVSISDAILNNQQIAKGTSYFYFALTFLDNDDVDKYFMYQELFIASLTLYRAD